MAIDNGTGTSIGFGTSSFAATVTAINGESIERVAIRTSHLGTTTAHTFTPGDLFDPGELSLDLQFDPDNKPPLNGAAETITVTFPVAAGESSGATWAASGFVTGFSYGVPFEELMTGTMTIKLSGDITVTGGAA